MSRWSPGRRGARRDDSGDPARIDPANIDPTRADPADADPADADPADADPADADPANFDPANFDPAIDPAWIDSAGTDSAGTDSAGTDSAGTDSAGTDSAGTDSAGMAWAGRTLTGQPFAADPGAASATLVTALVRWQRGGSLTEVVAAWAVSRVLVPVRAVLAADGAGPRAVAGDAGAEMALAVLTDPAGGRALPAFSAVDTLARWDAAARPVPVEAARAAQAAVLEDCQAVVLDPAGPVRCVLPRPAVWAVAQGRGWIPPAFDAEVLAAVGQLIAELPAVLSYRSADDGAGGLRLELGLAAGLPADQVRAIGAEVGRRLGDLAVVADRVAAVRLDLRPANGG